MDGGRIADGSSLQAHSQSCVAGPGTFCSVIHFVFNHAQDVGKLATAVVVEEWRPVVEAIEADFDEGLFEKGAAENPRAGGEDDLNRALIRVERFRRDIGAAKEFSRPKILHGRRSLHTMKYKESSAHLSTGQWRKGTATNGEISGFIVLSPIFSRTGGLNMGKEIINIEGINNRPGTFHHVVKANGFLFLSSQLSCVLKTGEIIPGDIKAQTKRAMDNVKFLIESSSSSMSDIVKVVIYMRDTKYRNEINEIYAGYFEPGTEPAKVSVQAPSPVPGIDIEIEATAIAR